MSIDIDQSIKIEDTARLTVIADSLGNGVWISSTDKRYLQEMFRKAGRKKMFIIQTFSAAVAFVIHQNKSEHDQYTIDQEYDGLDQEIKTYILRYLRRLGSRMPSENIRFGRVGKKSQAHTFAYSFQKDSKKRRAVRQLLLKTVLYLFA